MQETLIEQVEIPLFEVTRPMRTDFYEGEAFDGELTETPFREGLDDLRDTFVKNAGGLIFRTIDTVTSYPEDYLGSVLATAAEDGAVVYQFFDKNEPRAFTPEEIERRVQRHYSKFFCFTNANSLRPDSRGENTVKGKKIFLDSKNYGQIDLFDNMDFTFNPVKYGSVVLPVKGDIVCILPTLGKHGRGPEAKYWFICSPQFLRAWTLIMYREHDAISSLVKNKREQDENSVRRVVFSGNCTMTNSYRAWVLGCMDSRADNPLGTTQELEKRLWDTRTEYASKAFVHVYSALVMMLRYAECPCPGNVPYKLDSSPRMLNWDLPGGWLERLIEKYNMKISPDLAIRFIEMPVPKFSLDQSVEQTTGGFRDAEKEEWKNVTVDC